ncbi:hypothetical protein MANES_05G208301v8 [Manihot esculenta]|uniref:Uncharacterized protein n=1 Tax=Manihot esculenta TaxID=3983 RepID=A0ACB7HW64_MANES|nr:hypothetical protein MANES_05G208301v8 [Manihot esculenta]
MSQSSSPNRLQTSAPKIESIVEPSLNTKHFIAAATYHHHLSKPATGIVHGATFCIISRLHRITQENAVIIASSLSQAWTEADRSVLRQRSHPDTPALGTVSILPLVGKSKKWSVK